MNTILKFITLLAAFMIRPAGMVLTHFKCRNSIYPRSAIERFMVPDDKINWSVEYKEYKPPNHTAKSIYGKPWADPDIGNCS